MKELSIEEKAKVYDEAIRIAKSMYQSNETEIGVKDHLSVIFPELAESEDEKIRKEIIYHIQNCDDTIDEETGKRMLAWLEKQGEHANFRNKIQIGDKVTRNEDGVLVNLSQLKRFAKHAAKVEPKFHKGDIIKPKDGGHEPWQIMQIDISDKKYRFADGYVIHFSQEDDYELVEQKPAWSEEDRKIIIELIGIFESAVDGGHVSFPYRLLKDYIKVLKSCLPQQQWKPSDEQMDAFNYYLENEIDNKGVFGHQLVKLYQDLKKLKNE